MIIENGYIRIRRKDCLGIDPDTRYPIPDAESWCCPVPCQKVLKKEDRTLVADGAPYTGKSYAIYVEYDGFPYMEGDVLRLYTLEGCVVGEYVIRSVERLEALEQYKLTV